MISSPKIVNILCDYESKLQSFLIENGISTNPPLWITKIAVIIDSYRVKNKLSWNDYQSFSSLIIYGSTRISNNLVKYPHRRTEEIIELFDKMFNNKE